MPPGFQTFQINPDQAWMTIRAVALDIAGTRTSWPADPGAFAVVDTGGTCVFLCDPRDLVSTSTYPDPEPNPPWTVNSKACQTVGCTVSLTVGDANSTYSYKIDPAGLPAGAGDQTLVMCEQNEYMRGLYGLNTGGISMLVNYLAIDYSGNRVGWKPK